MFRGASSKSPTMNHSPTLYADHMSANQVTFVLNSNLINGSNYSTQFIQASLMEDNSLSFLTNASMLPGRPRDRSESPPHDHHIR